MVFEGESAVPILVELFIEGDEFYSRAEIANGSVDLYISIVALVVYVLYEEAELFKDVAVTAGVGVYLMHFAESLRQVAATFLKEGLIIVVLAFVERDGDVGVYDAGEFITVRRFPLR